MDFIRFWKKTFQNCVQYEMQDALWLDTLVDSFDLRLYPVIDKRSKPNYDWHFISNVFFYLTNELHSLSFFFLAWITSDSKLKRL